MERKLAGSEFCVLTDNHIVCRWKHQTFNPTRRKNDKYHYAIGAIVLFKAHPFQG